MKLSILSAVLVALMPLSVYSAQKSPSLSQVIDAKYFDMNNDTDMDSAVLVEKSDSDADLYIFTGQTNPKTGDYKRTLAASMKGQIWHGRFFGTHASLGQKENGSLLVHAENDAIGRFRWHQQLTIAYRDGQFKVVGVTYDAYDTIDLNSVECDYNLLTGKGTLNGKNVDVSLKPIPIGEWKDSTLPKECRL